LSPAGILFIALKSKTCSNFGTSHKFEQNVGTKKRMEYITSLCYMYKITFLRKEFNQSIRNLFKSNSYHHSMDIFCVLISTLKLN